ncbi:MAG: hypothetical protein EA425_12850 [Puniceicoccaceae bacterium]|nr:MAG: hypothetical protein EA425_12850 [Puniceicoccaceae bacterium]
MLPDPATPFSFPLDPGPGFVLHRELPRHPAQRPLLWIGNSYTGCFRLPLLVKGLSLQFGPWAVAPAYCIRGGESLTGHEAAGHARELIEQGGWHAIILQDWSKGTFDDSLGPFLPGVRALAKRVRATGAALYLYQTWERANDPGRMDAIEAAYAEAARETGATVLPCGRAWAELRRERPDAVLHIEDDSHPTLLGSTLAALVQWRVLGGQPLASVPTTVDLEGGPVEAVPPALVAAVTGVIERVAGGSALS